MTDTQFRCPQCGGRHFGSTTEQRSDGSIWKVSEECHDEFKKGCTFTRPKIVCLAKGEKMELNELKAEWMQITGEPMPDDTASQPIEIVRKAVHWMRQGVVGVIPKTPVSVPVTADDSMAEWDTQDDGHLNSYGS